MDTAELDAALHTQDSLASAREVVTSWLGQGLTRQEVLVFLENYRGVLREGNRDADEDTVLEVMDALVGWCSLQERL